MKASVALVCLLLTRLPGIVQADAIDPAEELDQNDETEFRREGFAIGVGLGPALFLGSKAQSDARGGGGSFSLRLGTTAGEKLLWFAQLDSAPRNETSVVAGLSVGAHYYLRDALWVRGGLGVASFNRRAEDPFADGEAVTKSSLALAGGAGVDVYRRGIFAIDLELNVLRAGFDDGPVLVSALQLVANWY